MSSFAGLPPFVFGTRAWVDQLVCPLRTFVRANDGSRDLLAPMLAWSAGPPAIGDTGDNSPSHMLGTTWLTQVCPDGDWVLYRESRGVLEVIPWDDPPTPVSPTGRHVSLTFDQAARVVVAWEDQGIIKVRRWEPALNQYIENVSFSGVDPVVVLDASWGYRIPGSDVLLFYLSSDRERVMCRVQRDVYGTEHLIWDYGAPVILDRVIALPYRYQVLVSDATGSPLPDALVSALYPVALPVSAHLRGEFALGGLESVAVAYAAPIGVRLTGELASGAITLPVVAYAPVLGLVLAGGLVSGAIEVEHDPITTYQPQVPVRVSGEFREGTLDAIGVRIEPPLGLRVAGEFVGGTYEST